jgi:hypothetical protein
MAKAGRLLSRLGNLAFLASMLLVLSLWISAAACVKAQRSLQGSARDTNEAAGRELWKFETGG